MRTLSPFARFLRFFFKHLYTTVAWSYDLVAWSVSIGQWKSWVFCASQPVQAGPVLELGYGPGHLLLESAKRGWNSVGIDQSKQMARIAARRLRRHAFPQRAILGRSQQLPFPSSRFRYVLCTFPDEYILAEETLSEILRVLQPGGSLIVVAMAEITGAALYDRLAAWLFQVTGQTGSVPDAWQDQLRRAGFQPQIETVRLPRSQVTRVAGSKPA